MDWKLEPVAVPVSQERGVDVCEIPVFDPGSFAFFSDPDGNGRAAQQVPGG